MPRGSQTQSAVLCKVFNRSIRLRNKQFQVSIRLSKSAMSDWNESWYDGWTSRNWDSQWKKDSYWQSSLSDKSPNYRGSSHHRTPPRHRSSSQKHDELDFESPTGRPQSSRTSKHLPIQNDVKLPDSFEVDQKHLDKQTVKGKTFLKYIATSAWSGQNGLQGKEVTSVQIADLCYKGWDNASL